MGTILLGVVATILVFGFIIAFHEFCHLIAAKLFGVEVLRYSIGFGKPLVTKRIGETEYAISALPLGGYVKLLTEEEIREANDFRNPAWVQGSLESKARWKQIAIIAAGGAGNILLGTLLFFCVAHFIGYDSPTLTIATVIDHAPAQMAGVRTGDRILALNGKEMKSWYDFVEAVLRDDGSPIRVKILRDRKEISLSISPTRKDGRWMIGVGPGNETMRMKALPALETSCGMTYYLLKTQIEFFGKLFHKAVPGHHASNPDENLSKQVAGPIGIFQILYRAVKDGLANFIYITAVLNIAIGFMNLLPVYPIDGGRILFLGIEMVLRRPISREMKQKAQILGIALFLLAFLFGTFNDIHHLFG
ncbi:MAG: site-2 protease family protein [Patescibacteria group bacterium]|nr:site-2 protease family protein [Patescibacteria group bacterium]